MTVLHNEIKDMFRNKSYAIVGTASKDGIPNAVAMGSPKILDDETLCFACSVEGKTFNNVHENPTVAITVIDTDIMQQHQIKGTATIETSGPIFEEYREEFAKFNEEPKCVVKVAVRDIYSLRPAE